MTTEERTRLGRAAYEGQVDPNDPQPWERLTLGEEERWCKAAEAVVAAIAPPGPIDIGTAKLVCVRDAKAHLFADGDDAQQFLESVGNDWSFAAWTVTAVWHPKGDSGVAPVESEATDG